MQLEQEEIRELARAAGFFNGEGSTYVSKAKRRTTTLPYLTPRISITQKADLQDTRPEDLVQFDKATGGHGVFYGPFDYTGTGQKWQYRIAGTGVRVVLDMIFPWLSEVKKNQARIALRQAEEQIKLSTGSRMGKVEIG